MTLPAKDLVAVWLAGSRELLAVRRESPRPDLCAKALPGKRQVVLRDRNVISLGDAETEAVVWTAKSRCGALRAAGRREQPNSG